MSHIDDADERRAVADAAEALDGVDGADGGSLRIDCDECAMQGTDVCADCVVTFICSRQPDEALVVDVAEVRALRLLSGAGLVPRLRHVRRPAG